MRTDDITLDGDRSKQNKKPVSSGNGKRVQSNKKSNELKEHLLQFEYIAEIINAKYHVECSITENAGLYTLHGPAFMCILDENYFYLYLEIHIETSYVAELMKIFCFVINPSQIINGSQYYWDDTSKRYFFNEEAKEIKKDREATKKGLIKCPYCERFFSTSKINKEKGCCVICDQLAVTDNITFH